MDDSHMPETWLARPDEHAAGGSSSGWWGAEEAEFLPAGRQDDPAWVCQLRLRL